MKNIIKRCEKCGVIELVKPRERKCKRRKFGKNSYCCWGTLRPYKMTRQSKPKPKKGLEYEQRMEREAGQRVIAWQKRLNEAAESVADALKNMQRWEKVRCRFTALANRTEEDRAADSQRMKDALAKKNKPIRALKLG